MLNLLALVGVGGVGVGVPLTVTLADTSLRKYKDIAIGFVTIAAALFILVLGVPAIGMLWGWVLSHPY